jgi:membrane protease YdiL (CAAX protease family)
MGVSVRQRGAIDKWCVNIQYNLNIREKVSMPTPLDIAFAIFFAVGLAGYEALYADRRFKAQVAAGVPDARRNAYRRAAIGQWVLAVVAVLIWARAGRPWTRLGLVPPTDWRLVVGLIVVALIVASTVRQMRAVARLTPERRSKLAARLAEFAYLLPHNEREYRWFSTLSVTAGVCEELLYRGYLTWVLGAYVGVPAALALVAIGFGLAHAYQGRRGIVKTASVGLVLGAIVLATGWLVPAMIVHALVDFGAGVLGVHALGDQPRTPVPEAGDQGASRLTSAA